MEKISTENITTLVSNCKKECKSAQYQLFNQYYGSMYAVCNRIVPNSFDAEEVLQDAFVAAFAKISKLKKATSFGSWLKQIVIHKSINFIRSSKKIYFDNYPEELPEPEFEEDSIYQIDKELVNKAVKQLPEGCRIVLILYLIESYKHREIAEMLKISISTSKSQYLRAKLLLKEGLTKIIHERQI